jgi:hypothetical protein
MLRSLRIEDLAAVFLVIAPSGVGFVNGLIRDASSSLLAVAGYFFGLWVIGVPTIAAQPNSPVPLDARSALMAMAALWCALGWAIGEQARSHIQTVGRTGYAFTLGHTLVSVCLGGLLIEIPYQLARGLGTADVSTLLSGYLLNLNIGIFILVFTGLHIATQGIRSILQGLLAKLSVFGLLAAGAELLFGEALGSLLWWVPGVPPPLTYQVGFSIAIGFALALPTAFHVGVQGSSPRTDRASGLRISMMRAGAWENNSSIKTPPPIYRIPPGWVEVDKVQQENKFVLKMRPTNDLQCRLAGCRLEFQIQQYKNESIADVAELRSETAANLKAWDAFVLDEDIGMRHGVISHEFTVQAAKGFVHLIWFVVHHHGYIIQWRGRHTAALMKHRSDVERFVDGLVIE